MNALPPNQPSDGDDELLPDARLRSALQHAPDGASRPPPALRSAVLQAARASLPPRPAWWQRLLGIEPGHAGMPRLWTAVAGVGAFGLALNLAWQLSKAPRPTEFDKVAAVSEAKRDVAPEPPIAPLKEKAAEPLAPATTSRAAPAPQAAPPAERQPMELAQAPARRGAAPAPAARSPSIAPTTADAPAPAAPPAPPAPVVAAAPQAATTAAENGTKELAKEERSNLGRLADAAPAKAQADGSADARARGALAPAAVAPTGVAAAPFPASPGADSTRSETAPLAAAAAKPAAPAVAESFARAKSADKAVAPAAWPLPLARFSNALNSATDWPPGWQVQGPADFAAPRRAWWLAMLAGTAGRWQAGRQPLPPSVEAGPTWRLHGPDGAGFVVTLADGQAWLQADGAVWQAPWAVMPAR